MSTSPTVSSMPLTAATDSAALARLRALPADETEALLDALLALKTHKERQDYLIGAHRLAPSLSALDTWFREAQKARDDRRFADFLADVSQAAERAEVFRELISRGEQMHQVNVVLLAARLFDALVARDQTAIEKLAHTFAEVVGSITPARSYPTHRSEIPS